MGKIKFPAHQHIILGNERRNFEVNKTRHLIRASIVSLSEDELIEDFVFVREIAQSSLFLKPSFGSLYCSRVVVQIQFVQL